MIKSNSKHPENRKEIELLHFLSGKMSKEEAEVFKLKMEEDQFLSDAADGLVGMDKEGIPDMIADLNFQLKKQINKKKKRAKIFNHSKLLIWVSVIVILLFVFIAWWYLSIIIK